MNGGAIWAAAMILASVVVVAVGTQLGMLPALAVWIVLTLILLIFLPQ